MGERIDIIDVAKGLGIFLIIWGHCMIPRSAYIYSFHVPLFFVISGYLYSSKDSFKTFLAKKFKRILIPFFFFSFCTLLLYGTYTALMSHFSFIEFKSEFLKMLRGLPINKNIALWFLPCLFCTSIIYRLIDNNRFKILILIFLALIGYYCSIFVSSVIPYKIDVAFSAIVFYGIGYLYKTRQDKTRQDILSILLIICIWLVSTYLNKNSLSTNVSMHVNRLGNFFLFYISALSGIMAFMFFCKLLCKHFKLKILKWMGTNSLILMSIHYPFLCLHNLFINHIGNSFIAELFMAICITTICFPITLFCKKFIPKLSGY